MLKKYIFKSGFSLFIILIFNLSGFSQAQFEIFSSINTGSNALASNKIRSIHKDGNKMVFTHVGGVTFFDGSNWSGMITGKINQNEIRDYVNSVDGSIYLPTMWNGIYEVGGPNYLNAINNHSIYTLSSGKVPTDRFFCAEEDSQGRIWFGTEGSGLVVKIDTNFIIYNTSNSGLLNDTIYDIVFKNNKTYIGTHQGLSIRDSLGSWTNYEYHSTSTGLTSAQCLDLFFDSNSQLWIGTYWGLNKWNGDSTFTQYTENNGMLHNHVKNITQDNVGNIWLAHPNGLSKLLGSTFTTYTSTGSIASIPYGDINCLEFDNNNNLWVGTEEHGVMRYNGNIWTVHNTSDGLPFSAFVFSIGEDSQGSIWFSSTDEYFLSTEMAYGKLSNGQFSSLTPKTPTGEKIGLKGYNQLLDVNNRHWISTTDKGVAIETNGVWQIFTTANSFLPTNSCRSLAQGANGDVWMATNAGLVKFTSQLAMTVYTTTNGLANDNVYDVVRDFSGNIWVATINGLSKFNGTTWTTYDSTDYNVPNNTVYRLAVDKDSNLWVSFYGNGLAKFDGNTWTKYDFYNSNLPSNYYYDLITDKNGDLIAVSSNYGVSKRINDKWINYTDFQHTKYGNYPNGYACGFEAKDGSLYLGDWDFGVAKLSVCKNFSPQISVVGDSIICQGDSTFLQANNSPGLIYKWYRNNVLIAGANQSSLAIYSAGTYYVHIVDTIFGCITDSEPKTISVNSNKFNINFTSSDTILSFAPFNVNFTNLTPQMTSYNFEWNFGDGYNSTYYHPFHQYLYNGIYSVKLIATHSITGCKAEFEKPNYITASGGANCNVTASIYPSGTATICYNDSLKLSANLGLGYSYQWVLNGIIIAGATDSIFWAKTPGQYAVVVANNICSAISQPFVLTAYPANFPQIIATGNLVPCTNDSTNLSIQSFYNSYSWSTGATSPSIWVSQTGYYQVSVVDQFGCSLNSQTYQLSNSFLAPPSICIIGVDSASGKNRIIWERQSSALIDSIVVLRETNIAGIYDKIGSLDYSQAGIFIDTAANPAIRPWRYKLAAIDSCGAQTLNSPLHKSIHLTINAGLNGSWNLLWNSYEGLNVGSYYIYRGTATSSMQLLAQVPGNINSFTDLNPPSGTIFYQIEIIKPDGCFPDSIFAKANTNYNTSRSNHANNGNIAPIFLLADFNADITTGQWPVKVNFTDISSGIPDSWRWQFGDGNSSIEQNPEHTYNNSGLYTISLRVCNGNICDTIIKTNFINVLPNGSVEINSQPTLSIFPNPSNGIFNFTISNGNNGKMNLEVLSPLGQIVYQKTFAAMNNFNSILDLSYLSNGVYNLRIADDLGNIITRKIIIQQ